LIRIVFLRFNRRLKEGKEHWYWNIVENRRCVTGKVVRRQVLYLGEINDSQHEAWCRVIEAFDEDAKGPWSTLQTIRHQTPVFRLAISPSTLQKSPLQSPS
jgi:hypothetical protein